MIESILCGFISAIIHCGGGSTTVQFIAKQEVYNNVPAQEVIKPEQKIEIKPEPKPEPKVEIKQALVEPEPVKVTYSPKKEKFIVTTADMGGEIVLTEESKNCYEKKYMFAVDWQHKVYPGCWEMIGNRINISYGNGERYSYEYDKKVWKTVER